MDLKYNPYSEDLRRDPWPLFKRLRDEAPVYYMEEFDAWALSRFEDVWQASMDPQSYSASGGTSMDALLRSTGPQPSVFLFKDPPEHAKYRNVIRGPYQKDSVNQIEGKVRGLAREQLNELRDGGQIDLYAVASRVALYNIADMIGLERDVIRHIRALIDRFYQRESGIAGVTPAGLQAFGELRDYVMGMIEDLRRDPPGPHTHIGAWLAGGDRLEPMSDDELFFNIFAMTVTGSDTVPLSTAATIYYLTEHPDQMRAVREDRGLIPHAFEEAARFDQPTNILGRTVKKEVVIHGKTLKVGQKVLFLYAAANRDEREFERADEFLIERRPERTLSFGIGPHFCLGQHLARLEGRVILEELFEAAGDLVVDKGRCSRIDGEFLQGFNHLPVELRS
ncbi:MAG: cytochrome P450 [Caulobacteraceae bacterium]|nr:cytochrome P450 [Caulobacteraceae bacterium]